MPFAPFLDLAVWCPTQGDAVRVLAIFPIFIKFSKNKLKNGLAIITSLSTKFILLHICKWGLLPQSGRHQVAPMKGAKNGKTLEQFFSFM